MSDFKYFIIATFPKINIYNFNDEKLLTSRSKKMIKLKHLSVKGGSLIF